METPNRRRFNKFCNRCLTMLKGECGGVLSNEEEEDRRPRCFVEGDPREIHPRCPDCVPFRLGLCPGLHPMNAVAERLIQEWGYVPECFLDRQAFIMELRRKRLEAQT